MTSNFEHDQFSMPKAFILRSIILLCLSAITFQDVNNHKENCFCQLKGQIGDCSCTIDTLDYFNNNKIYPRIQSILVKDYFRYFKVNMERPCPFWSDDSTCSMKDCSVSFCSDDQIPVGLKGLHDGRKKYLENDQEQPCDDNNDGLGAVNHTISEESIEDFKRWSHHDESKDNFCEMDDEQSLEAHYVDLLLNPERYTGYKGASAHRIWKSIYQENCFKPKESTVSNAPFSLGKNLNDMCLEKRAFYRAISGLHSSINIHLSALFLMPSKNAFDSVTWGPNIKEFHQRFDPKLTDGEGPQRLLNLYFLYLLELRALAKVSPYLEKELFYTGNKEEDKDVRLAVMELMEIAKSFPNHFNESVMFSSKTEEDKNLKDEFKAHFRNISRIMDCVGCSKCKLWGKLQVQGLGTAFKILFSGDKNSQYRLTDIKKNKFQLTRAEIVTLLNAFGRLSNSIRLLEMFRKTQF